MNPWPVGLAAVVLLVAAGWYLSYLAARLDRLHHRVETSAASLSAQLARRCAAALRVADRVGDREGGEPTTRSLLRAAAERVSPGMGVRDGFVPDVDVDAENDLTRALHDAFPHGTRVPGLGRTGSPVEELLAAQQRVHLARRFHNDAVAHVRRMRAKRVVRWAKLAGHARMPEMVELDDSVPAGLDEDRASE